MEGGGRGRRRAGRTVSSSWYCFSSTRPMTPRLPHSSGVRGLWVLGPEASPRLALPSRAACTFPFTSCGRASVGRRGMHSLSSLAFSSSSPPARKIDKRARNEGRTKGKRRDMRMRCTKRSRERAGGRGSVLFRTGESSSLSDSTIDLSLHRSSRPLRLLQSLFPFWPSRD